MRAYIKVNLQYAALHSWPGAEAPVEFLKHPHRHVFHISCWKPVQHLDRDIEIITLKKQIEAHLEHSFCGSIGTMSCEQLAEYLIINFGLSSCQVLEDGENGALVVASDY